MKNLSENPKINNIPVIVLQTPITERYCKIGDIANLDIKNKQIKCSGAWFNFDNRWIIKPYNNEK